MDLALNNLQTIKPKPTNKKEYSTHLRPQELEPQHQIQFSVSPKTQFF